ncbi:DUF1588 domain-containing protein [Stieleria sp. TO1_6]|uniref:DUF1588 domain-containing protein n=1 Tax=Stieleria tagensis TaxID=2956795 RepID=UPI00209A9082|nr:DUF1588 domain-containing protein [Stieleria tagensis]MCO8121276.1 DUF1588 domain-containing protein [Stieleria tagensis]
MLRPNHKLVLLIAMVVATVSANAAEIELLQQHCGKCHSGDDPEGDFHLDLLGSAVTKQNQQWWQTSMDSVSLGDMPPGEGTDVTDVQRVEIAKFIRKTLLAYEHPTDSKAHNAPRRLNNREFANSISDALGIEDPGTHFPLGNLLGDTLHEGFDTNGDALGISEYHLEQYIESVRKIIQATVLSGNQTPAKHYNVLADSLRMTSLNQNTNRKEIATRNRDSLEFRDMRLRMYFENFQSVPTTGYYRLKIRATGVDRGYYDSQQTGIYDGDPIRLAIHFGDRVKTYDLPDNDIKEIVLEEWLAEGTRIELSYPTDGLRERGNGNFKFQQAIAHDYIKEHDPELYRHVVNELVPRSKFRSDSPGHWSHWVDYWRGPRPRVYDAEIEGPIYRSWPPERHVALIGDSPIAANAEAILKPIAERAWRRQVRSGELDPIVQLVTMRQPELGDLDAIKEGMVAIFVSPSFLLINPENETPSDRFATKLAFFLSSTIPQQRLRDAIEAGICDRYEGVLELVNGYLAGESGNAFLEEFPHAWLQLDRINFMAPDPDRYPYYHRKSVSDDMIAEAKQFFRHAIETNMPLPELLTANYSFINADLATIYGVKGVPDDSQLRKYVFEDGRRGGLLGMGAFLTLTADSLGTSPIHRAVYVLENFMGIKPSPPPGDVEITEPDVRQAKTIKEILGAHIAQETCASCHRSIDPYGYAFENFDPVGQWRDHYVRMGVEAPSESKARKKKPNSRQFQSLPIDASATFRNGKNYQDIVGFRQLMKTKANQEQFVRCFIEKLLIYANGAEPENAAEVERIVVASAEHDYRIVDTIAAVIDSPLFREQ